MWGPILVGARGARYRMLRLLAGSSSALPSAVALTFDDGPVPGSTDRVLDVLAALDVRATFFCVGRNAQASPVLLRRIAAEGHAVGSHSLTHAAAYSQTPAELVRDYRDGKDAVEQALGAPVRLFRPPYGQLRGACLPFLRSQRTWLWTRDPRDWDPATTSDDIVACGAAAQPGDVVLLHDWVEQPVEVRAQDRSETIRALPGVVAALRRREVPLRPLPAGGTGPVSPV